MSSNASPELEPPAVSTSPDPAEAWLRARRRLQTQLGEDVFTSWFARLELDAVADGTAHLSVPTRFLKNWIQQHFSDRILTVFASEAPAIRHLKIEVRPTFRPPVAKAATMSETIRAPEPATGRALARPADPPIPLHSPPATARGPLQIRKEGLHMIDGLSGSPLDRRLTFATFLVGRSNQLAHAAAERVVCASSEDPPPFNPLYIHASVGLGKTHLLQAIAHAAPGLRRRAIYLTAEKFMYGFVSAIKAQTAIAFKEKLRAIDVLVIDDVQFLQGKSIQNEFCHTLNSLIDAGRQIVVAADRPPADLESLDERVRSRLAGGLCVEMAALDEALRVKILETRVAAAKALQPGFDVPGAVLTYVARTITSNGRDLDGAVHRLAAHATLTGAPLTIEAAEVAVRDLIRSHEPKKVKIEDIQKLVASHYNVTRADILSARRTANVVLPRQIAMFLSKALTMRSLPEIGRRFGGRDHTTVLHAVRKIDALTKSNTAISEEIELLKRTLQQ
ncbi:MAG: chromosomal replication initiator protein DnaA [Methylobacteriaceae bacterium]|nr:chromosomal replication initiator protein DnaA [Methylobacteriaceae bacterium]MBV9637224.1 chromosomal replication initiator protein DnaA [Methylobacteriaceae bacterium]MBV9704888.1 chromosomal replication initiator protein DnaA [Methylobacteriaceae bacterium]